MISYYQNCKLAFEAPRIEAISLYYMPGDQQLRLSYCTFLIMILSVKVF